MDYIEKKIDKIQEDITEIKQTLVKNTASLDLHIYRTTLAEQRIEELHDEDNKMKDKLDAHINQIKGAAKMIALIGSILVALWQMGILAKLF